MFENLLLSEIKIEEYINKELISDALCFKRLLLMNIRKFFSIDEISNFLNFDIKVSEENLNHHYPKLSFNNNTIREISDIIVDFGSFDFRNFVFDDYTLRIINCSNIILRNLKLQNTYSSGILIYGCNNLILENCHFKNVNGYSITIGGQSKNILINNNSIEYSKSAGILIGEESSNVIIKNNTIQNGFGKSNWEAGIVLVARDIGNLLKNPYTIFSRDQYWPLQQRIFDRIKSIRNIIIQNNIVKKNMSSGIYIDGAIDVLICGNTIERNSKEGICLDQGTTRTMVLFNTIIANGQRWGKSDYYLMKDFVLDDGRMSDGTANAKVPGLSIDNSILNLVAFNNISDNYGSGIKMVRTSFLNELCYNLLVNNNLGQNDVHHFFGIEIGSAVSDFLEGEITELDFLPSSYNFIHNNTIVGKHWSGIYVGKGCIHNKFFNNVIMGFKFHDIEKSI